MRLPYAIKAYLFRNRILFILLALLSLGLIVERMVFRIQTRRKDRVLSFSMTDIVSFTVLNNQGRLTFVRNGPDWTLEGVPGLRLGKREIDSFLDACRDIRYRRKFPSGSAPESYGLHETNVMVRIVTGRGSLDLVKGRSSPGGSGFYLGHAGRVHLADNRFANIFEKNLFTFRDKRIAEIPAGYVRKIGLDYRGERVRLEKKDGEGWVRLGRPAGPVPVEDVNAFLFEFESYEAREFISGRDLNWEYFGFPAANAVELTSADGTVFRLGLGRKDRKGLVVGREPDPVELVRTDPYLLTTLSNYVHLFSSERTGETVTRSGR